jgi:hypothetical protein
VIAYRSRDYHNGTGSRVFLTENPVCYNYLNKNYPSFLELRHRKFLPLLSSSNSLSRDEISFKGGRL